MDRGLPRDQLERLVLRGEKLASIAETFGVAISTVRYWIGRYELPQPRNVRREVIEQAFREGRTTLVRHCKRHGETQFAIVGSARRLRCKRCRAEAVARRRRKVKRILVEEAGGRCQMCGYDDSFVALEFHHLDPTKKTFGVAQRGITRSIDKVRAEARKCVLICANCHAEVEAGVKVVPVELKEAAIPR
jgi:hypothetical protein